MFAPARSALALGLAFAALAATWAEDTQPLLHPDEAFQFSAELVGRDTLALSWDIADGYYLYRQKFKFAAQTADIVIDAPSFPTGQNRQDPQFGNVEIFRERLELVLPFQRRSAAAETLNLEVTYQGCADIGVCYLPIRKTIGFDLPEAAARPE
ncbi:protein-disulfide reductase DsbD N-terminal domain-containing protein [Methylomonas koyamae]|uniref:protein-disulfide reductase DsbD N-terminal domain-containing protein n=1 Tax=Methylomonas koyamae TaxID=702114 RepID=UPI0009E8DA14|nr:protein-disulfide reductase DsbD N-terminal domain-containing protein [Methylomonas koyamae]BBL59861.1 hypothetical protein MKFW12EY_34740 [Methylomonas koyamae]